MSEPKLGDKPTELELQVLRLVASGLTNRLIMKRLKMPTASAVSMRVLRCSVKLGAKSRPHAVAIALSRGLIVMPHGSTPRVAEPVTAVAS